MLYSFLIPIVIIVCIIIAVIIILVINKQKNKEEEPSILDVMEVGVTDDANFAYGYEKEETIIMDSVDPDAEKKDQEENNNG